MSVWVSQEVMRCCLRFCSRRSPWQQRSFLATTSIRDTPFPHQRFAHIWVKGQSKTRLDKSFSPVRFYARGRIHRGDGRIHRGDLEEKQHPSSAPPESSPPDEIQRGSPLLGLLRGCSTQSDVLDLTCQHPPTYWQIRSYLTQLWSVTKRMPDEQRRYELRLMFEHPAFDGLLQKAMENVRHMRHEDVASCLLCMIRLGVPQRSRVVQTFLRSCQKNLNDFDEKALSFLASCLKHMEDDANVGALKEGLRLVVETRLPGIKNVTALQLMMGLMGKDAPLVLKRKLEGKALSMADQFSIRNAHYVISTLATMNFYSKPLLDVWSKIIKENLNGIPLNKLLSVLHSCKELRYKDLDLLTGISDYLASTMELSNKKQVLHFLSAFNRLAFCPSALMETFTPKVIADPDALALKDLLCVLKAYSSLNYDLQHQRQQFLDSLIQALGPYLSKMPGFELLNVVYRLCLLGHFPSAPLEQLLQSGTLEEFNSTEPQFLPNQQRMFQTVDLCLRLDRPPLPQPLAVPPSLLGDPAPSGPPTSSLLSEGLRSALGDQADAALQETVVVENFYLIDAVITKPNQTPVTDAGSCAGEQCPPSPAEGGQRIAVVCVPPFALCHGTSRPRGILATKLRHLKVLGYDPVVVPEQELKSEEKRTDFLRGLIFPEHHRSDAQAEVELGS